MVDATHDTGFRAPGPPSDLGGPWQQPNIHTPPSHVTLGVPPSPDPSTLPPPDEGGGKPPGGGIAPAGGPALAPPQRQMDPSEMAMQVSMLISRIDDAQSNVEQNGLQVSDTQKQEAFKKSNDAIAKAAKKLAQAKHRQKILGPLATIGKILGSIAAVALTVCTAGAAAPLAVAMIAYTVVDTALTIADSISQAAGGPALDLGSLLQKGFTELAKKCGASDQEAATIGKWTAFGVQAAIALATIAVSIKGVVQMVKGTAQAGGLLASKLGTTAFKATKIAGVATQFVAGATNVTAGGLAISVGVLSADAAKAQADKTHMDAVAAAIQEAIRNTLDRLQLIAADLSQGMQSAAKDISDISQTNIEIAGGNAAMV
ncbi:YopB/SseC family type III secretion system translocon subunit [Peristeroidobacter soli]|uniref:YopB/SseC family type III secretion system translocon subunit n=1 Tax=Peristeroidobacter soli TaxID=2497877 RepID=UPI00101C91E2|nr:YopB/SseC family type III secretion system translocon subunit [Peristeroidobacter soli]